MAEKSEQNVSDRPAKPPRLLVKYREEIAPAMQKKYGYTNVMQIPRLKKIVLNMGVGAASRDIKELDAAEKELTIIAGQKPRTNRAKLSVSQFKIRQGMPLGCSVTLRGARMWAFLDKLVNATLPRVRDFRGISAKGFDGHGNYTLGFAEATVFPEMAVHAETEKAHGVEVSVVTTAPTNQAGFALLSALGFPFKDMLAS